MGKSHLKASTLNLFNNVVHFDDSNGFNGYFESVEMYNYYKSIPSGLIAARMTYLCEKYKFPKRADGSIIYIHMHMNDAYFAPATIWFPYEMKKIFDRILHELQYLDREHPHHFTLDLDQSDGIFEYRFIQSRSYSFTSVELEYMFDTLGFLWLHHGSPPYFLYLLEKLVDGLSDERMKPPRSTTTSTL